MFTRTTVSKSLFIGNLLRNRATNASAAALRRTYATKAQKASKDGGIGHTIGYQMAQNVRKAPFANALRSSQQQISWSFSELRSHTDAFACGIHELGLRPGQRVLLYSGSTAEQIVTMNACAKAGAELVLVQEAKNEEELSKYLELFNPRMVIVPPKYQNTNVFDMLQNLLPDLKHRGKVTGSPFAPVRSRKFTALRHILLLETNMFEKKDGTQLFHDVLVYGPFGYYETPLRPIAMKISPDSPVLIHLDSNDVNKAKPIVYSHRNLLNSGQAAAEKAGIKQGDRVAVAQRHPSVQGIIASYASLVSRATLVYPTEYFDAAEFLTGMDQENVTVVFGTAQELQELVAEKEKSESEFRHLKTIVVDSTVSSDLIAKIREQFGGVNVVQLSGVEQSSGVLSS